jgi:glycosyltransferase involved in cell wall biosynthesis
VSKCEREPPAVSVIVPLYNGRKYIERCLAGIFEQTYPAHCYEVIVVDNDSNDGSAKLVGKYPQVRLLTEFKRGAYAARNRGVKLARGGVLAFTDADCWPSRTWLEELMMPFNSTDIVLVQGGRVFGRESAALSILAAFEAERVAYSFSAEGIGTQFGYTNNMAVRREVFDRCGPFFEIPRGADSIFVDRVVRTYSYRAVRFARDALIRHLEVKSIRKWLAKKALYGRSLCRSRPSRELYRDFTPMESRLVLQRTIDRGDYSASQAVLLSLIIFLGALSFTCGRISGKCVTGRQTL